MKDKAFVDTNCLIYWLSEDEPEKKAIIAQILEKYQCVISTQVLNELCNVLLRKFHRTGVEVQQLIAELKKMFPVQEITVRTIDHALRLHTQYRYSYFDSLMLASALETSCRIIFSEDMQHQQMIKKSLQIINPFVETNESSDLPMDKLKKEE